MLTALWKAVFLHRRSKQCLLLLRNLSGYKDREMGGNFCRSFFRLAVRKMKGGVCVLLKNITQDIVFEKLEHVLHLFPDVCTCTRCRLDIAALALNQLPPRYVVTDIGAVYSRVSGLDMQIGADTVQALTRAIEVVQKGPRHAAQHHPD